MAESFLDQIMEGLPVAEASALLLLDVDTVVVHSGSDGPGWIAFVWARARTPGLGRYLALLEAGFTVVLVNYSEEHQEFHAAPIEQGRRNSQWRSLELYIQSLPGVRRTEFRVSGNVQDRIRQSEAFWGYLVSHYRSRLKARVVLPRILINCAIQPYFRAVWNVDRVVVRGDAAWVLEIKHKFPFERKSPAGPVLQFGLNNGELGMLNQLAICGIESMHLVMVKPYWSKAVGAGYLLSNLRARDHVAILGAVLNKDRISNVLGRRTSESMAHTTITGKPGSTLSYKSLAVDEFMALGNLGNVTTISRNLASVLLGAALPTACDSDLRALRLSLPKGVLASE